MIATFDFETRGSAGYDWNPATRKWQSLPGFAPINRGLPVVGTRVYVEHWSFAPVLLAYDLTPQFGGATAVQWEYGQPFDVLFPLFEYIKAGGLISAFNAEFEREVWNYYCVPVWGWPPLKIEQQRCDAAASRAAGYPGALAKAAAVLRTPTQKDADGDRLMKIFSMPRNPTKDNDSLFVMPADAPDDWARYKSYNRTDIIAEHEVSERVPPISDAEQRRWILDQKINDRGMAVDSKAVEDCISIFEQASDRYGAEFRSITDGIEHSELKQFQGWLHSRGVHLDDMTEKSIDAAINRLTIPEYVVDGEIPPPLRALQLRQMLASASVKKLYALRARTARDGRVHGMYQFHATHHGRTGGYGVQPANLYKGAWHTPEEVEAALRVIATRDLAMVEAAFPGIGPIEVISNVLRSLFVAGPGCRLISSDYSAIEGVTLACLAGEQWIIDVFRTHGMIYEAQISQMTGVPFEEFVRYKRETGKHHPLRHQGKLAVLSGGYASWINGWKKFGADQYYKSDADIKAAILAYRNSVPNIVEFWGGQTRDKFKYNERPELYGLEGAAISAVKNPGQCYRVGLIAFQMQSDTLHMQLPSGRTIQYHAPRLTKATRPYSSEWELSLVYSGWNTNPEKGPPAWIAQELYGGVLTQNAVGGTARDVMMHGMENADRAGYPICMHTYDEIVADVPFGTGSVEGLESCMNDLPDYARDWPIRAKGGWEGRFYGKFD